MPRQRMLHKRAVHVFPQDFAECLERIKVASGLPWNELARRLGTNALTIRRWRAGARPDGRHLVALVAVASDLGLAHLLPRGLCIAIPEAGQRGVCPCEKAHVR